MVGRAVADRLSALPSGLSRGLAGVAAVVTGALFAGQAFAQDAFGRPTDKAIGLQASNSALRDQAAFFHDWVLFPIITVISLFVLALLVWIVIRYNGKANPVPAKFTHNTMIEIIWTVVPVIILAFISIFSFKLLYAYHDMPKPDVTVKVTGNQWFWSYEYPDAGYSFDSNPLTEAKAEAKGAGLYRLAVDNPMVVPVGKNVQVLATGADVLHAFFVPAFGIQTTTIPGRVNTTWFKAEKEGVFYGQCNELCGVNHSFMPIEIDVVSQAKYDAWIAAHKKPTALVAAATPAAPAASGGTTAAPAAPAGSTASPASAKPAAPAAATPAAAPAATKASTASATPAPAAAAPTKG